MIRHDCFHLKRVTNNDIHEGHKGTLRCDVNRAEPHGTTVAGISCLEGCMGYRRIEYKRPGPLEKFKEMILSIVGK